MKNYTFEDGYELAWDIFDRITKQHFDTGMPIDDLHEEVMEKLSEIQQQLRIKRNETIFKEHPEIKKIIKK
ncbi:MAG: hypothetical protein ACTSW1_00250 [Candidatus Hodarchaeales archaeon]